MKILLLSAYDAMSHAYWRKGLVTAFPEYDWTVLTLPPRYFNWRLRGNSLSWALGEREVLEAGYDLLVCTSMTDLSALKGMVQALSSIPTICYFHENQFAYPQADTQHKSVEPKILNLYTALAADHVLFNTAYNRETFLGGASQLLKKLPDHVPSGVVEQLRKCSSVLPVPLPDSVFEQHSVPDTLQPLQILWNHRWEYDKAPERFFMALDHLKEQGVAFQVHVVGQSFRKVPDVFARAKEQLSDELGCWGYVERVEDYRKLLQSADVVVSTAIHDFQGIAVLEAVAAGCYPLVPDRLAYPELFPLKHRYRSYEQDPEQEARVLARALSELATTKASGKALKAPDVQGLSWHALKPCYQEWLEQV
ncbi:MAG: tRNA-queuosine alpha-mannosyltransferase domain-containing protein [Endozoicomonas sp.]|uniref:tRNA-queuosine alpha-mannosyltransferase domain-containing protein n=1 Tax=Endozoicomonas sp. TaxID=1892382 RepID=UPI003D9B9646